MHNQERELGSSKHPLGDAALQPALQTTSSMRRHHQQVTTSHQSSALDSLALFCRPDKRVCHILASYNRADDAKMLIGNVAATEAICNRTQVRLRRVQV